jgi:hypothetical protein
MVFLIHLDLPKQASHYITCAEGEGSRPAGVIGSTGVAWRLARTWEGGRELARRLKSRHQAPLLCPICSGEAASGRASLEPKAIKITMSHRDQIVFCLSCPLAVCVSADHPLCPMQAEQRRRNRDHHERMKASGWVERRRARRAVARQAALEA